MADRLPTYGGSGALVEDRMTSPAYDDGWPRPWEFRREEPEFDLRQYWRMVVKHRIVIALMLIGAIATGVAATLLSTPIYTAFSTLQIDRESVRVITSQDVQPGETSASAVEFYETQYGLLRSRALASRVVDRLGLAQTPDFLTTMGALTDRAAPADAAVRRDQTVDLVQANLGIHPVRDSRLVQIAFDSPSPMLSARIANAFAENFIASSLDRRQQSSSYARDYLEQRLAQAKARLEDTERQLVQYATDQQIISIHDGDSPDQTGTQSLAAADLSALNASLTAATAERIRAQQRWRQAQASSGMNLSEVLQSPTIQQLSQRRAQLAAEYQDKLSVYKADFPSMLQLKAQLDEVNRQLGTEAGAIRASLRSQYVIAANQEGAFAGQVNRLKSSVLDLRNRSIRYNILQREVETNRSLYDALLQRYREIGVSGGVTANNISVVDKAEVPLLPSRPRPLMNVALSALLGLGLGVAAALVLEALDQAVRSPADVETKLGLPLLGAIPKLQKGVTPAQALSDLRSPFSEAYYSLRTALQVRTRDGGPQSLLLTSSRPAEGKSTSALAIAMHFARLGQRTLLVDGDLRNPSLHKALAANDDRGLTAILSGDAELPAVVQTTAVPNLSFVACGPLPSSPAELLASGRLRAFVTQAEHDFDFVVIDGPAVLGLADAPMIASVAAATLLVVGAGGVGRNQIKATAGRLQRSSGRLIGVVVTKFDPKHAPYGVGSDFHYVYGGANAVARV